MTASLILTTPQAQVDLAAADAHEQALRQQVDASEQRLQLLYQKRGRSKQFSSGAERDAWVKAEVSNPQTFGCKSRAIIIKLSSSCTARNARWNKNVPIALDVIPVCVQAPMGHMLNGVLTSRDVHQGL